MEEHRQSHVAQTLPTPADGHARAVMRQTLEIIAHSFLRRISWSPKF
jgi:hypothetical protein